MPQIDSTIWYNYYSDRWLSCEVDKVYILSKVPKRLTQEEADAIISTLRNCS